MGHKMIKVGDYVSHIKVKLYGTVNRIDDNNIHIDVDVSNSDRQWHGKGQRDQQWCRKVNFQLAEKPNQKDALEYLNTLTELGDLG